MNCFGDGLPVDRRDCVRLAKVDQERDANGARGNDWETCNQKESLEFHAAWSVA